MNFYFTTLIAVISKFYVINYKLILKLSLITIFIGLAVVIADSGETTSENSRVCYIYVIV